MVGFDNDLYLYSPEGFKNLLDSYIYGFGLGIPFIVVFCDYGYNVKVLLEDEIKKGGVLW